MRSKKLLVLLLTAAITLSLFACVSGAVNEISEKQGLQTETGDPPSDGALLSPGLKNIASRCRLKVSGGAGMTVDFEKEDFLRALNLNDIDSITVTSLPDPSQGELTFMGESVKAGLVIDSDKISSLEFAPCGTHVTKSFFTFCADNSSYDICGEIYVLDGKNSSPTVRELSVGGYVSAFTDVSYKGHLSGYDPDGDSIEYMIVKYPQNGILILDQAHGQYEYHPDPDFTGKDTFKYVIFDEYGAYSSAETVVVNVDSVKNDEKFSDMEDRDSHAEAIYLSRSGILGGREIGGRHMFLPDEKITRGELISVLMSCCEVELKSSTVRTVFADDSDIPKSIKAAVAAAYELGYVDPIVENGRLYFKPDEYVTVAECASILNRILSIDTELSLPVSSIIESCPEDALLAVSSLCSVSILPHEGGIIDASEPLTREYAAKIVYNVKTFLNLYRSY